MASPRPSVAARIDRALAPLTWLAAALVVVLLFAGPQLVGAEKRAAAPAPRPASEPTGAAVFRSAGCGGCHTLAAAGASAAVGPNLDELRPDAAAVEAVVTAGSGSMPSFQGELSAAEIEAVAEFVADSTRR
jgi:cytochrome c6